MAIRLEVQQYCSNCLDFEPDVTKPERVNLYSHDVPVYGTFGDTIIHCKNANRCASLVRYLNRQNVKEDKYCES